MKRSKFIVALGVLTLVLASTQARAGVVFYLDDAAGFTAAVAGRTLIGFEDFEGSTLPAGSVTGFDDPLTQGVANGPYPTGLVAPMSVQPNTLGGGATVPSPRGPGGGGLAAASAGFAGNVSDVVVANFFVDSHDTIFAAGDAVSAVGFNPINFFLESLIEFEVYDTAGVLIGTATYLGDPAGIHHVGIVTTAGESIGRINSFSLEGGGVGAEGVDNVSIYGPAGAAVPEPGTLALAAVGVLGLAARMRRKS